MRAFLLNQAATAARHKSECDRDRSGDEELDRIKEGHRQNTLALYSLMPFWRWKIVENLLDKRLSDVMCWKKKMRGLIKEYAAACRSFTARAGACDREMSEIVQRLRALGG